jgi:hypothetical protein
LCIAPMGIIGNNSSVNFGTIGKCYTRIANQSNPDAQVSKILSISIR